MMREQGSQPKQLQLKSVIGFSGNVPQGLIQHPDKVHRIYPLGSNVIIHNTMTGHQEFLQGHTNLITCITLSKSGEFLATGQVTHMGFQAEIIVWDFITRKSKYRLSLHKVQVQAVAFSPQAHYLASLGGQDDNSLVIWDMATGKAICGSSASKDSTGVTLCLEYLNTDELRFVTGGYFTLRVWEIHLESRKLKPVDCQLGTLRRITQCICIDSADTFMYCGSSTGDVLKIDVETKLFKLLGPVKKNKTKSSRLENPNLKQGVCACCEMDGAVYLGSGDGAVVKLDSTHLHPQFELCLDPGNKVTSCSFVDKHTLLLATSESNLYTADMASTPAKLNKLATWHYSQINDVAFPKASSLVFATCSDSDIRIWGTQTNTEYMKIDTKPHKSKCILFNESGSSLISGWSDSKIRAYGPQSGRLQYVIHDAHKHSVTALAVTQEAAEYRIVSGGEDGEIRIWHITAAKQTLVKSMKEHKGIITSIQLKRNNLECVTSCSDGSCIIWDMTRYVRNAVLFAPSFFKQVRYFPVDESQLITVGTDRKVSYWDCYNGTLIREIRVDHCDQVNGLDLDLSGSFFVMGGSECLVQLFLYGAGVLAYVGMGHSTEILKLKLSPDQKTIVSVSKDGAIFQWQCPSVDDC